MVPDGNCDTHGGQGHVVSVVSYWVIVITIGVGVFIPKSALASHVAHDGLPQRPGSKGAQHLTWFDWRSYMQVRFTHTEVPDDRLGIRRLKVMLGGHLDPRLHYFVQGLYKTGNDSPTDDRPSIQEAWLAYMWHSALRLTVGQFKPPFGMERFTSDIWIASIDRAQATDHLVPNGKLGDSFTRDRGIQLDGWAQQGRLYYAVGLFEGEGANTKIRKFQPLLAARVAYRLLDRKPFAGQALNVHIGGAFAMRWADGLDLSHCCPGNPQRRALLSFDGQDIRWNMEFAADWGRTSFRSEYFYARFDFRNEAAPDFSADGWYVQVAHYIFGERMQLVAKWEGFNPNRSVSDKNDIVWTTLGMTYFFNGHRAKVMANYVFKQEEANSVHNDALLIQAQYFFK
ncbi:MAG: hypothetical protein D6704_09765 [Nitrospirae bacterium]|nr:MAG: hypothetical protein D6704_09765 [Nitrospirota bacterium]